MRSISAYLVLLVVVALLPALFPVRRVKAGAAIPFPGWPMLEGRMVLPELPLTEAERGFAQSFPGKMAKFGAGNRQYVVRWITAATRRVHPAEDCFRASGYSIHHEPHCAIGAQDGAGCFTAKHNGTTLSVQERITDSEGHVFSDVSAWYWAAIRGESRGPWWSVTTIAAL